MIRADKPLARVAMTCALAAALGFSWSLLDSAPVQAQSVSKTKTKTKKVDGRKSVISGIKLYEAGKMDKAITALTKAVRGGGLSSQDLAKALYFRGLALEKSGKSADAIADLTNAVWMKGGLTPDEEKKALSIRSAAYAKLGVKDPGPPVTAQGTPSPGWNKSAAAPKAPAAAPSSGSPGGFQTKVARNEPAQTAPPTTSSNPLSGVGSFFSNIFSGGSSSETPASSAPTASINTSPSAAPTAVSGWSSQTSLTRAEPAAPPAAPKKTAKKITRVKKPTARAPSGAYKLQVAAVRSRDAAEQLVAQLSTKHAAQIGTRTPDITETVFGNMGTFYQVNVGPFASQHDTNRVCKVLKADGFDCLVVKK